MTFPEILLYVNKYIDTQINFNTLLNAFQGVELTEIRTALDTMKNLSQMYTRKQYFTLQKIYHNIQK